MYPLRQIATAWILVTLVWSISATSLAAETDVDVVVDVNGDVTTVEILLPDEYRIVSKPGPLKPTTSLNLALERISMSGSPGYASTQLDFDEPEHELRSVKAEYNGRSLALAVDVENSSHFELLPQYTRSHVLLAISQPKTREKVVRKIRESTSGRYALTLEKMADSSADVSRIPPSFLADHILYLLPETTSDQKWLRAGYWDSKEAAMRARSLVVGRFPKAQVITVDENEETYGYKFRLNPQLGLARAELLDQSSQPSSANVQLKVQTLTPSSMDDLSDGTQAKPIPTKPRKQDDLALRDANDAFIARDYARAITLYTKAMAISSGETKQLAHERLAVARELNGQTAHATRLYREYLSEYPNTQGANRIEHRLSTLTSLATQSLPQLRQPRTRAQDWQKFASVSQFYRRHQLEVSGEETVPIDGLFTDLSLIARKAQGAFSHEARVSLTHLWDQTDRLEGRTFQVGKAYWDSYSSRFRTGIKVGRQSKYEAGVLGRFDGLTLRHDLNDSLELGVVGGFLLDSSFDGLNQDRPFYGLYSRWVSNNNALSITPFIVQQYFDGTLDRRAVGLQSQFSGERFLATALVDHDIHHNVLNKVTLMATVGIGTPSTLSFSFDQRKSPYVTTRNALIGQPFNDLNDLEQELVDLSLKDVASDRAATTRNVRLAWNRTIDETWEFTTDVVAAEHLETETSANVVGFPDRRDYYYSTQLRAKNVFGTSTYSGLLVRYIDGENASTTSLYWTNRFKLGARWWLYPRVRVDQRTFDAGDQKQLSIFPTLRLDYRHRQRLRFEFEVGYETTSRETIGDDLDISGLFFRAGYRATF